MPYNAVVNRLIALCLLALCCPSATAQAADGPLKGAAAGQTDSVYLFSPADPFDTTAGRLDEFIVRKPDWRDIRKEIVSRAREKGANAALVRFHGNVYRGYYVRAVLFSADDSRIKALLANGGCSITIFRDSGPTLATYTYAVTINGMQFTDFRDQRFINADLPGCPDTIAVRINRESHAVAMQGRSRYFRLLRAPSSAAAAPMPGTFGIMIPIFSTGRKFQLQEMEDAELGRLLSASQKRHQGSRR